MIYIGIAQHSPDQCPGSSKENMARAMGGASQIPVVEKKYGVKVVEEYIMLGSHKQVTIIDAPNIEAAEMALLEAGVMGWNTVELNHAITLAEAVAMGREMFPDA